MSRYYLHVRDFEGNVIEDDEGSDLPSLAVVKKHALLAMHELVADAVKRGNEVNCEAVIVVDKNGTVVAAVPLVAALSPRIVGILKEPAKVVPANRFEEYRRYADDCRSKAEDAADPDDKMSWLKLANAWLQMLPQTARATGWPKASDEHSKASH